MIAIIIGQVIKQITEQHHTQPSNCCGDDCRVQLQGNIIHPQQAHTVRTGTVPAAQARQHQKGKGQHRQANSRHGHRHGIYILHTGAQGIQFHKVRKHIVAAGHGGVNAHINAHIPVHQVLCNVRAGIAGTVIRTPQVLPRFGLGIVHRRVFQLSRRLTLGQLADHLTGDIVLGIESQALQLLQIFAHILLAVGGRSVRPHHRFVIELFNVGLCGFDRLAQGLVGIVLVRFYRLAVHCKSDRVIADQVVRIIPHVAIIVILHAVGTAQPICQLQIGQIILPCPGAVDNLLQIPNQPRCVPILCHHFLDGLGGHFIVGYILADICNILIFQPGIEHQRFANGRGLVLLILLQCGSHAVRLGFLQGSHLLLQLLLPRQQRDIIDDRIQLRLEERGLYQASLFRYGRIGKCIVIIQAADPHHGAQQCHRAKGQHHREHHAQRLKPSAFSNTFPLCIQVHTPPLSIWAPWG